MPVEGKRGNYIALAATLAALGALLLCSQAALESARAGLTLCAQMIVPSLLPFFILSSLLQQLGLPGILGRWLSPVTQRLFGIGGAGASALLLGVTGCAMSTPASVGSIGGVDIPAGIYLLAQYNAYNTASGAAKLATGETASNVKAVLKAECTGTINGEDVTTDGADYVARLTLRSLQYYAAVEKKFDELGGTLDEAATAEAAKTADTQWENNSDLYAANGISKTTSMSAL